MYKHVHTEIRLAAHMYVLRDDHMELECLSLTVYNSPTWSMACDISSIYVGMSRMLSQYKPCRSNYIVKIL